MDYSNYILNKVNNKAKVCNSKTSLQNLENYRRIQMSDTQQSQSLKKYKDVNGCSKMRYICTVDRNDMNKH